MLSTSGERGRGGFGKWSDAPHKVEFRIRPVHACAIPSIILRARWKTAVERVERIAASVLGPDLRQTSGSGFVDTGTNVERATHAQYLSEWGRLGRGKGWGWLADEDQAILDCLIGQCVSRAALVEDGGKIDRRAILSAA